MEGAYGWALGALRSAGAPMMGREGGVDTLLLTLIILALAFVGTGFYVSRPGYHGVGAGLGVLLHAIAAIFAIVLVLRLLGIV